MADLGGRVMVFLTLCLYQGQGWAQVTSGSPDPSPEPGTLWPSTRL